MTHRDELLALQARVEAQAREIDEAKSEISLLRAAHAQKTREVESLRRGHGEGQGPPAPPDDRGLENDDDPAGQRRTFGFAAALLGGVLLTSTMMVLVGGPCGAHRAYLRRAQAVEMLHLMGQVAEGSDPAVARVGDLCTVVRQPMRAGSDYDCRIEVQCGDRVIYGTTPDSGFARCGGRQVVRDRNYTSRDGDPALTMDLRRGQVVVEEELGLGTQRVVIDLVRHVD